MPSFFGRVSFFIQNQREQRVGTGHTGLQFAMPSFQRRQLLWNFVLNRCEFAFRYDFSKVQQALQRAGSPTSELSHERDHKNSHQVVLPRMSFRPVHLLPKRRRQDRVPIQIQCRPCSFSNIRFPGSRNVLPLPQHLAEATTHMIGDKTTIRAGQTASRDGVLHASHSDSETRLPKKNLERRKMYCSSSDRDMQQGLPETRSTKE